MKLDDIFNEIITKLLSENSIKKECLYKSIEIFENDESYYDFIDIINKSENEDGTINSLLMIKYIKDIIENPEKNNIFYIDSLQNDNKKI